MQRRYNGHIGRYNMTNQFTRQVGPINRFVSEVSEGRNQAP